jgi:hypothetical protein
LRQVPNLLGRVDCVGVVRVHDACVVKHDVDPAPGVEVVDEGFDIGFFGNIADLGNQPGRPGRGEGMGT